MFIISVVFNLFFTISVMADPFHPSSYTSGGSFPTGTVTIDTDALEVNSAAWSNAQNVTQTSGPDVAVFTFDGGQTVTANVTLSGLKPAVILFQGNATISGTWVVNSGRPADVGSGTGAGTTPVNGGGGGGGFGGNGGKGGSLSGGAGGSSYGDLLTALEAGSGGGGVLSDPMTSAGTHGGGGIGGIEIGAEGLLDLSGAVFSAAG